MPRLKPIELPDPLKLDNPRTEASFTKAVLDRGLGMGRVWRCETCGHFNAKALPDVVPSVVTDESTCGYCRHFVEDRRRG